MTAAPKTGTELLDELAQEVDAYVAKLDEGGQTPPQTTALPEPINVPLYDFARAFRFGDNPIFNFRVLSPKLKNAPKPTKEELAQFDGAKVPYFAWLQSLLDPYGVKSAPFKENLALNLLNGPKHSTIRKLTRTNGSPDSRAVYYVVNQGGQTKDEIVQITAFFIEYDDLSLEEQYAKVMALPIPPNIIVKTRSSLHCYWLAVEATTIEQWEAVQRTFIVSANSDPTIKDLPRVMRVPGFDHTTFDFETGQVSRVSVTVLKFDVGERLTAEQMLAMLAQSGQPAVSKAEFDAWLKTRNGTNKQRAKVRQERERKGAAAARVYAGEPPADLQKIYSDICAKLSLVGPAGDSLRATCPCCEDPSPSLIVGLVADKILMTCHAGCTFAEICEAIGIEQEHCFARKKDKHSKASHKQQAANGAEAEASKKAEGGEAEAGRQTQADMLIEIAETVDLCYSVEEDIGYAHILVNGHQETHRIHSKAFRQYLMREFYGRHGKIPNAESTQNALNYLDGRARFDSPATAVYLRLAPHDGRIYWDLANDAWQILEISAGDWRAIEAKDAPVRFRRSKGMLALPAPVKGGDLSSLKNFINYPDHAAWSLHATWLVAALRASARAFPILILNGEQGSAKSTASKMTRILVDPNVADLRPKPREDRDLYIAARNGWVCAFDNLSGLPREFSDALCRLATGAGFGTRELYENDEETLFNAARPIIVNGIDDLAEKADLIDRGVFIELPPIPDEDRRDEETLWADFESERPKLLGALADTVADALKKLPNVQMAKLPRMADFAKWGAAASVGGDQIFLNAYLGNRTQANDLAIRANDVAAYVAEWYESEEPVTVTLTDLLRELTGLVRAKLAQLQQRKPEKVKLPEGWPTTERKLGNEFRRCAPNLRRVGIEVVDTGLDDRTRKALRVFQRCTPNDAESKASQPSQATQASPSIDSTEVEDAKDARRFDGAQTPEPSQPSPVRSFEPAADSEPSQNLRTAKPHNGNGLADSSKAAKVAKVSIPPRSGAVLIDHRPEWQQSVEPLGKDGEPVPF